MTIDEFIDRLRKAPRRGWSVYSVGGLIRRDAFFLFRHSCPITAISDVRLPVNMADVAGDHMGLSSEDSRAIIMAADDSRGHDPALRARILEAVGLTEVPDAEFFRDAFTTFKVIGAFILLGAVSRAVLS